MVLPATGYDQPHRPISQAGLINGDAFFALGISDPCELIEGSIVPMIPPGIEHGVVEMSLAAELVAFVRQHQLGWVSGGEAGVYTRRNPDTVRGAELLFISKERLPDGLPRGFLETAPDLIVEIVSPSDRWQDMQQKLEEYFSIGVPQVWIINPKDRSVMVYASITAAKKLREDETLTGEGSLEGFSLPVKKLFS